MNKFGESVTFEIEISMFLQEIQNLMKIILNLDVKYYFLNGHVYFKQCIQI